MIDFNNAAHQVGAAPEVPERTKMIIAINEVASIVGTFRQFDNFPNFNDWKNNLEKAADLDFVDLGMIEDALFAALKAVAQEKTRQLAHAESLRITT